MADGVVARVQQTVARSLAAASCPREVVLLAAVSGGQDSLCLLHALCPAVAALDGRLLIVHVDHRLRGKASTADAEAVSATAASLGCEIVRAEVDVAAYAARNRLGLEEAGRSARYQVLASVAAARGAWGAATGHTRDDRAEALLINIVRGTGPAGLTTTLPDTSLDPEQLGPPLEPPPEAQMTGSGPLRLVRPLLTLRRAVTAAYCRAMRLEVRHDSSNVDPGFLRNRVRRHLLPLLKTYNPAIVDSLVRLAEITADDEIELDRLTQSAWRELAMTTRDEVCLGWASWENLSPAIQRRLLRRAAIHLGAPEGWSFRAVEDARLMLTTRRARRRLALGSGVSLETSRSGFVLRRAFGDTVGGVSATSLVGQER